jgi:hypothetical protein
VFFEERLERILSKVAPAKVALARRSRFAAKAETGLATPRFLSAALSR